MHTQYHQITLKDTFSDCQDVFWDDAPSFFKLLGDTSISSQFFPRLLSASRAQATLSSRRLFSSPTDSMLILFLAYLTPNLMIYVNSETILKIDLLFSPYIGRSYPQSGQFTFNNYLYISFGQKSNRQILFLLFVPVHQ